MGFPAHLSDKDIAEFGREMDLIRNQIMDSLGDSDRAYILRVIRWQRSLMLTGRIVVFLSFFLLPASGWWFAGWPQFALVLLLGAAMLGASKSIENMELGHNVMHAQWDWMRDPNIQSNTWEWDNVCPSDQWKHSHNVVHHTWTNVHGKDPDIGYGVLRVTDSQPWKPWHVLNPLTNFLLMMLFQWGVALHDLEAEKVFSGEKKMSENKPLLERIWWKARQQLLKDYILWPLVGALVTIPFTLYFGFDILGIALQGFAWTALANLIANGIRNIWSNVIIFCGHFPEGVHHFTEEDVRGETRAHWYMRQLMSSCNLSGGKLFHLMSGNLSHQIEHHLFPDMPSNRLAEASIRVEALAKRYGLHYNKASFRVHFGTTTQQIWKYSLR